MNRARTDAELSVDSPLGVLRLRAAGGALTHLFLPAQPELHARAGGDNSAETRAVLTLAARQLDEYFAGRRHSFEIPIGAIGTPFQTAVWAILSSIPFGAAWTYLDVAKLLGRVTASRAVGHANARNPIAIVVPCHRVIASSGGLSGYAGGTHAKQWLLGHESS